MKKDTQSPIKKNGHRHDRHVARIAAVQALYQIEQVQIKASVVIKEFIEHRFVMGVDQEKALKVDQILFTNLVELTEIRAKDIDSIISGALSQEWSLFRLEYLLRAILRVGCAEMLLDKGTPIPVIINEYVTITHEFYAGKEPGFVNGILNKIAQTLGLITQLEDPAEAAPEVVNFLKDPKTTEATTWEDEGGAS
ncbi:MAG: transcription antitermination factor NusB [Alphaproteobacteria bacterium]|nr:transcription antitermination factor NusB [Alphaproteobacteria bacterium]